MLITFKFLVNSLYFCSKLFFLVKQFFLSLLCLFVFSASLCAQSPDSGLIKTDTLPLQPVIDTVQIALPGIAKPPVFKLKNKLLNMDADPVSFAVQYKKEKRKDALFYLIAALIFFLAIIKYFNNRYFINLFRVFFNTSLRQSQLTDQLLQAKLASLYFNVFFVFSGGIYTYLLLSHYQLLADDYNLLLIFSSIALIGLIYLLKYSVLKFTGWVTGHKVATDTYIFVIFLINKIIGVFLVPFIVVLAFSESALVNIIAIVSLMSIVIFLLLRFFRSYSLLQNQLKISKYHFFLYLTGIEILPLLLVYKALTVFLTKNL